MDYKPDSVGGNHLSCSAITGRIFALYLILEVALGGVCPIFALLQIRVGSYSTISPLPFDSLCSLRVNPFGLALSEARECRIEERFVSVALIPISP